MECNNKKSTSTDEESQNQFFGVAVETIQTICIKTIMTNMTIDTVENSFEGSSVGRLGPECDVLVPGIPSTRNL